MTSLFNSGNTGQKQNSLLQRFPHWRLFVTVFAVMFTCTAITILLLPAKYESQMKILVSSEPQDLVITPNDGRTSAGVQEMVEDRVNSEIQVMTSRDVLRDVVMRSGLAHEPGTVSAAGAPSPWYMDVAVDTLGNHLRVEPIKNSDVIAVVYKTRSPEMAEAVLHNLADSYLSMHLRAHAKPGSFAFFHEQATVFATRLSASEAALQRFREQHAFDDPSQMTVLTQKALETEAALDEATAAAADASGRIRRGLRTVSALNPRITSQVHTSPQAALIAQLSNQLADLENRRTTLRTKFLPGDRLIQEVEAEISQTEATLRSVRSHPVVETTTDINQIREGVQKDLAASEVALTGLEARKATLAALLTGYRKRLADVAAASTQGDELSRAVRENEQNYLLYAKEREEARIARSLDEQRITDVSIVETPTYEPKPVSPVIPTDLAIGFLLSLMVAYLAVRLRVIFAASEEDTARPELVAA